VGLKRLAALACWLALLVAPPAAPAATVAETGGPTAVREYAGNIVFSQFDQATSKWFLAVRRAGHAVQRLPAAPSATPFEADIGPDSAGRPAVIYQRCGGTAALPTGCDLFLLSLTEGAAERPVSGASNRHRNDSTPTLWRGRIAWVREYGTQVRPNPVVSYSQDSQYLFNRGLTRNDLSNDVGQFADAVVLCRLSNVECLVMDRLAGSLEAALARDLHRDSTVTRCRDASGSDSISHTRWYGLQLS